MPLPKPPQGLVEAGELHRPDQVKPPYLWVSPPCLPSKGSPSSPLTPQTAAPSWDDGVGVGKELQMTFSHHLQALMVPFNRTMAPRIHSEAQAYSFQHIAMGHLLGANCCAGCWGSRVIKTQFLPPKACSLVTTDKII